jgi:small GTP-binding protein
VETYSKKICLLGDFAVGKTSLVRRFVHNLFDDQYISTIGVKVSRKSVMIPHQESIVEVNMLVWDLAGSQKLTPTAASYLRGAAGALLVCDLTRPETLRNLPRYAADLHSVAPQTPLVIAANKADLAAQQQISADQVAEQAATLHAPYFLTSALAGDAVDHAFRQLAARLLDSERRTPHA